MKNVPEIVCAVTIFIAAILPDILSLIFYPGINEIHTFWYTHLPYYSIIPLAIGLYFYIRR